jgi:4-hydroxybenzoate polyprenyltransferase
MSTISSEGTGGVPIAGGEQPKPGLLPIVVDLDGAVVKTDLLAESLLALLRKRPLCLFLLPLWMARGKVRFREEVARQVALDVSVLPWRNGFLNYLIRKRAEGQSLILFTGGDVRVAWQVADHLKIFDEVMARDGRNGLSAASKRNLLVSRFGEKGFDYAADGCGTREDLAVWASARKAILVNPRARARSAAAQAGGIDRVFADAKPGVTEFLKPLRPTHWLKNLLVFVPLFAAHRFQDISSLEKSLLAFVAFGCCASSGYIFNDLIDLEADRRHPRKRFRPFAAGALPLSYALIMIAVLVVTGFLMGALISAVFPAVLLAYFVMSALYSLYVKKIAILDVLFLAGLYSVRIMAGSAAIGVWSSHWLLAFSTFLFFSLALVKRYSELMIMRRIDGDAAKARAYELGDAELLAAMGTASGYLAVLVLALYVASDKARSLYSHSDLLWLLCPLLLYWISYVWLTAHRGKMHDDPVIFAISGRTSRILIFLMAATAVVAL